MQFKSIEMKNINSKNGKKNPTYSSDSEDGSRSSSWNYFYLLAKNVHYGHHNWIIIYYPWRKNSSSSIAMSGSEDAAKNYSRKDCPTHSYKTGWLSPMFLIPKSATTSSQHPNIIWFLSRSSTCSNSLPSHPTVMPLWSIVYFLLIGILQMIPAISVSEGKPTMFFPLVIVVLVSMVKDFFEDWKRRASDKKENHSQIEVLN